MNAASATPIATVSQIIPHVMYSGATVPSFDFISTIDGVRLLPNITVAAARPSTTMAPRIQLTELWFIVATL